MATKRTTHRTSVGKNLYSVRDEEGKFSAIQTYKRMALKKKPKPKAKKS